jgi:hypothetical protein
MTMFLIIVVKGLLGAVVWSIAFVVAAWILSFVPEGRIKRLLTRQVGFKAADPRYVEPPKE